MNAEYALHGRFLHFQSTAGAQLGIEFIGLISGGRFANGLRKVRAINEARLDLGYGHLCPTIIGPSAVSRSLAYPEALRSP